MKHIYCLGFFVILFLICGCHSKKGTREEVIWLYEQGKKWEEASQADSAAAYYLRSFQLAKKLKEDSLSGIVGNALGDILNLQSLYNNAYLVYQEAYSFNKEMKDKAAASHSLRGIGKNFVYNSVEDSIIYRMRLDSALSYFNRAKELIPQINDQGEIFSIYNNLSALYISLKEYNKALHYNQKSIRRSKGGPEIYRDYSLRAKIYFYLQYYDSALYYGKQAIKSNDLYTQYSACHQLANTLLRMGLADSALYSNKALKIRRKIEQQNREEEIMLVLHKSTQERIEKEKSFIFLGICILILISITIVAWLFIRHNRYKKITQIERNNIIQQKERLDKRLTLLIEKLQCKDLEQKKIEQDFLEKEKECVELQKIKKSIIQQKESLSMRLSLLEEKLQYKDSEQKKIEQDFLEKEKECIELQKNKEDIIQQKEVLNERLYSLEAKLQNKESEHKKVRRELHKKEKECAKLQKINEEVLAYNMAEKQLLKLISQKENLGKEKMGFSYLSYKQTAKNSYLKPQDQFDFFQLLQQCFSEYIQILESRFELKERETIICCLVQLGFTKQECANCIKTSLGAYYTIVSRLKTKIEQKFSLKEEISLLLLKEKG